MEDGVVKGKARLQRNPTPPAIAKTSTHPHSTARTTHRTRSWTTYPSGDVASNRRPRGTVLGRGEVCHTLETGGGELGVEGRGGERKMRKRVGREGGKFGMGM